MKKSVHKMDFGFEVYRIHTIYAFSLHNFTYKRLEDILCCIHNVINSMQLCLFSTVLILVSPQCIVPKSKISSIYSGIIFAGKCGLDDL